MNWTPRPSAVSYKTGKVPEEGASQGINPLKIQWDPSKAVASDEDEESQQLESLKVNWTARMPKEDEEEEAVPVVKWNPRQVPENGKPQQLESLKVNWTARMPKEDDEDEEEEAVPVVKWNTRQVPENGKPQSHHTQAEESEEEEVPKVVWKVRNVSEVQTKSRTGQVQKRTVASPDNTNASLLKVNWTPPTQRTPADNPLKIRWNPNMASLSSSEEDISSQRNLDAAGSQEDEEKEPPHRLSRYAAHVASQPVIPPATTTSSGLLGRRTSPANYTGRPVASVSPLQKGTGTGLRQPSPARSSLPAPSPSALKPTSGQIVPAAVRSRSLSPSQRGQDNFKGGSSQLRQPSPSQVSNGNGDQSPSQSRLRSPGQHGGSLGRKAGMRIYQPLTSQSTGRGSTQYAVRTERPSIISPQSSPTPKQPSPVLQQRKLTPVGIARPNNQDSSSGIRQPVSHR